MHTLDEKGIADNTVLIFLADNGTDTRITNHSGEAKTIRGGKGTMTDRGTRVPLIVRWPERINEGSTCGDLIDFSDLFPTLSAFLFGSEAHQSACAAGKTRDSVSHPHTTPG